MASVMGEEMTLRIHAFAFMILAPRFSIADAETTAENGVDVETGAFWLVCPPDF